MWRTGSEIVGASASLQQLSNSYILFRVFDLPLTLVNISYQTVSLWMHFCSACVELLKLMVLAGNLNFETHLFLVMNFAIEND